MTTRALCCCALLWAGVASAQEFLTAPIAPGAQIVERTDEKLTYTAAMTHDQAVAYFKEALKDFKDVRWRNWPDVTYIEDDSNRPWHSITISKSGAAPATIIVSKDSWTWVTGTLVLRFIGVFVVLSSLWLGMSVAGRIISRLIRAAEAR